MWGAQSLQIAWPRDTDARCARPSDGQAANVLDLSPADRARADLSAQQIGLTIAAYEQSSLASPFSSKFDLVQAGQARLNADEAAGYALFTGRAHCSACHAADGAHALFTDFTSADIGVPRNALDPYLTENVPVCAATLQSRRAGLCRSGAGRVSGQCGGHQPAMASAGRAFPRRLCRAEPAQCGRRKRPACGAPTGITGISGALERSYISSIRGTCFRSAAARAGRGVRAGRRPNAGECRSHADRPSRPERGRGNQHRGFPEHTDRRRCALMEALVLGAAAGGGFRNGIAAVPSVRGRGRATPRHSPARRRVSLYRPGTGGWWWAPRPIYASRSWPTPDLAPQAGTRASPIGGVVLVSADVDGIAGLLVLREGHRFRLFAPAPILPCWPPTGFLPRWTPHLSSGWKLGGEAIDTGLGLSLRLLAMPGKVALYQEEDRAAASAAPAVTYAGVSRQGARVCVAPACRESPMAFWLIFADANTLFFDGTLYRDDEMITAGLSAKTGQRMGHVSVSGENGGDGAPGAFARAQDFLHINNSNPLLMDDSPERAQVAAAGFELVTTECALRFEERQSL